MVSRKTLFLADILVTSTHIAYHSQIKNENCPRWLVLTYAFISTNPEYHIKLTTYVNMCK